MLGTRDRAIADKAHDDVYNVIIANRHKTEIGSHAVTDQILSTPGIAIVDAEAKLPNFAHLMFESDEAKEWYYKGARDYWSKIINEGWVRKIEAGKKA